MPPRRIGQDRIGYATRDPNADGGVAFIPAASAARGGTQICGGAPSTPPSETNAMRRASDDSAGQAVIAEVRVARSGRGRPGADPVSAGSGWAASVRRLLSHQAANSSRRA
jgi:hypothetical protein